MINKISIEQLSVLDICISNRDACIFALFCADGWLYLHDADRQTVEPVVRPENIRLLDKPVKLHYHHPYVCVSERFGLNAAVVDLHDGRILPLSREDYHADVSDYSIGFVERDGRVLLIHQTAWNRLDITDLGSGELLTAREVYFRDIGEMQCGKRNFESETKNYFDYFHGELTVSPDHCHFLSNGWVWQPFDQIVCYSVDEFMQGFDPCGVTIDYEPDDGYNWGRPCAFIDEDLFVIATDDHGTKFSGLDEEELADYRYRQFWFYRLSDIRAEQWQPREHGCRKDTLTCHKMLDRAVLPTGSAGAVFGSLHYDAVYQLLIAIGDLGVYALTLDGEIRCHCADIALHLRNRHFDIGESVYMPGALWSYSEKHHLFYQFNRANGCLERVFLQTLLEGR